LAHGFPPIGWWFRCFMYAENKKATVTEITVDLVELRTQYPNFLE